ncbi:MAG: restriction endonuclease [Candidatus Hermodarchaeota archaeon]
MSNKWPNLSPREFEWLCAIALKKQGYKQIQLTPQTQDEGIDIFTTYLNKKWGVEVKQRSNGVVGRPTIQKLFGATQSERIRSIVMTNTDYASTAKTFAEKNNIILIAGDTLRKWINTSDIRKARQCAKKESEINIDLKDSSFLDNILRSIFGTVKDTTFKILKTPVIIAKKPLQVVDGIIPPKFRSQTNKKRRII